MDIIVMIMFLCWEGIKLVVPRMEFDKVSNKVTIVSVFESN